MFKTINPVTSLRSYVTRADTNEENDQRWYPVVRASVPDAWVSEIRRIMQDEKGVFYYRVTGEQLDTDYPFSVELTVKGKPDDTMYVMVQYGWQPPKKTRGLRQEIYYACTT